MICTYRTHFHTKTRYETEAQGYIHPWAAHRSLWFQVLFSTPRMIWMQWTGSTSSPNTACEAWHPLVYRICHTLLALVTILLLGMVTSQFPVLFSLLEEMASSWCSCISCQVSFPLWCWWRHDKERKLRNCTGCQWFPLLLFQQCYLAEGVVLPSYEALAAWYPVLWPVALFALFAPA